MVDIWRSIRSHLSALEDTVVYTARHTCASCQVIKGIDLTRVMRWAIDPTKRRSVTPTSPRITSWII